MSLVPLPSSLIPFLNPYLPQKREYSSRPFVTLTWAQSLDSRIAASPGVQTKISHAETKTMTHYLRAYHDAILVGVGTVLADDPKLTCRYGNFSKIRPVVIDPKGRWKYSESTLSKLCLDNSALAPFIFIDQNIEIDQEEKKVLKSQGGFYHILPIEKDYGDNWLHILEALHAYGHESVMIEGGANVINSLLLCKDLVDSVVITIGPVFLGKDGVEVSPLTQVELKDQNWWVGEKDTVLAARLTEQESTPKP